MNHAHMHHEHEGHASHEHHHGNHDHGAMVRDPKMAKEMETDMRNRFFVAFALTIPIFLYSMMGEMLLGIFLPSPIPKPILLLILTTPVVFWSGSIFIAGAYHAFRARKLDMSVLIATGVLAAYVGSIALMFTNSGDSFYEAAAMLVTFVLFGHWMEMKSRRGTSDALHALFNLVPPQAWVVREGKEMSIPSAEIVEGDKIMLRPGDRIPVDGEVVEGESSVDESVITGESIPVTKFPGTMVVGGSVNQAGALAFIAKKVGADTVLARIIAMVETAQNSKAPGQRIADRAAGVLVVVAIGSGLAAFFGWYFFSNAGFVAAFTFAISAIVIACPDALGLATPTAIAVGTGLGAKHNILIKDATTLENTSKLTAVVLDKTGTLTEGKPKVTKVIAQSPYSETELLTYTALVERNANHPMSAAILEEVLQQELNPTGVVEKFESLGGLGVRARVNGSVVVVGTEQLMRNEGIDASSLAKEIQALFEEGNTVSVVAINGSVAGVIGAADSVRISAKKTVRALKDMGLEVVMITGDHERVAATVAREVGIERYVAQTAPEDKAAFVKKLQSEGKNVAMVGDGINDAPALAQADIGIAIGAGTDVAIETGNIVLMKSDPYDIVAALRLSKATVVKMKQNLFWAAIYNLFAIPVAAGVFYSSLGWSLRPEISALLMSVSSIVVATNAVLLKRVESRLKV